VGLKMLIVDDSMLMRDILKESILETFPSLTVSEAGTGDEAQKMLQMEHFDIVMCDWGMPGLSGIELLKWVRSNPSINRLPFVMVTGTTAKESIVECVAAGVTDYVVKPFIPELPCKKMQKILKMYPLP